MNLGRAMVLTEEAKKNGWTVGAELGLWDGRTLFYLLENVPGLKMIGVDAFRDIGAPGYTKGKWNHLGNFSQVVQRANGYSDRLILFRMLTTQAACFVRDRMLDFVFIDADHSTEGVIGDISTWIPKVKRHGFMVGHDINWLSVRSVVETYFPRYETRKDHVWISQLP